MNPIASPKTTIVIPCVKNNDLLFRCINACLSLKENIEIFVMTEEPPPKSLTFSHTEFIQTAAVNMSTKRNLGAKKSRAAYIAFIDSDAYPEKHWIHYAIKELQSDPSVGMVGGPELSPPDESLSERWVGLASRSSLTTGSHSFRKRISPRRFYTEMSACNLVMRREEYLQVGGMNEDLYIGEDQELGKKVREKLGKKVLFSPEVIVYHKNREFLPFLIQRYARGMAVALAIKGVIKEMFSSKKNDDLRNFRWELFVAPGFILFLFSILIAFFWQPWIYLYGTILILYLSAILLEAKKNSEKISDFPGVFFTLLAGTLTAGVAALLSLLNFNVDMKKLYRNKNDLN